MAEDYIYNEDNYDDGPPAPLFWRIIGKTLKFTGYALIALINGILLWRLFFSTNEPNAIKTIASNPELAAAWQEYGADGFALYQAEQDNIATDEDWHKQFPEDDSIYYTNQFAQFFLTDVVFFPKAGQTQVVLRYNKSILEHIATDYELENIPGKKDDLFDVSLVVYYKDGDATKSMRLSAHETEMDTTSLYTFRQFYFDSMPEFDGIIKMNVEIYYKGEVDYNADPYSVIEIYDKLLEMQDYTLDKKDIAALESGK
jgi:hypothetical protein